MKEPVLEKVLRQFRLAKVLNRIEDQSAVLDVGCGWESKLLRTIAPKIRAGTGIDFKVDPALNSHGHIHLIASHFDGEIWPIESGSIDTVTMLAVIEHIEPSKVDFVLSEIKRVLRAKGQLLITVPTTAAKPVLEFMAYKLKIINEAEIRDHKLYYSKQLLQDTLHKNGFSVNTYQYFQLGMNSFCSAQKN